MKKVLRFALSGMWIMLVCVVQGQGHKNMTRDQYIKEYASLAMKEMARSGIPASITLAQGCLESGNGNSTLAVKGNNHFGIKCHGWKGKKMYHDDDEKNECFRVYKSPYESFIDHSDFLTTRGRYSFLFDLKPRDYRGWAKGLKKAGYATARNYATLLIQIIEDNELYRYDVMVLEGGISKEAGPVKARKEHEYKTNREVLVNNGIEYIIVQPGDRPEALREELDLYGGELYRYNNLYKGEELIPGQIIYLQPKRRKAAVGNDIHRVEEGQTMYDISQIYGVKVRHLYRLNRMEEGAQPVEGAEIYLRRRRPGKAPESKHVPEPEFDDVMEFRFEEG